MRMRLHKSTVFGDYEIYPIYELNYDVLSSLGLTMQQSSDNVGANANKYRQWVVINNQVGRGISLDIPRTEVSDGCILPFWHRFTNLISGRHYLDQDVLSSFAAVQQGIKPDDWGTNPNYVTFYNGRMGYFDYQTPIPQPTDGSWSSSTSYYEDTKRTQLRKFYTDTGCSFSVSKTTYFDTYGRLYMVANFPDRSSATATYNYTAADGTTYSRDYKLRYRYCINGNDSNTQENLQAGYNMPHVFVHYSTGGVDFYGIALIQMSDFTENSVPVAIAVSALDSFWWGSSIIAGGGDSGNWGPVSYQGGGNGVWTFPSNNRGDTTGATVAAIATERRTALQAFYGAAHGYQLHQILPAVIPDMFGLLYSSSFIDRYTQSIYNPLSAVISLHLLPARLCEPQSATSELTLSGYSISNNLPTPQNFPIIATLHHEHIGTYDFEAMDNYLDYAPFTSAYLHLPYIGVLEIDVNAIAAGSISIDYLTDAQTGNCAAYVSCIDRDGHGAIKYCATGNCAYTLPMYALNQDGAAVGKIVGSTLGLGMAAITGNAAAAVTAARGLAGGVFDAATAKRNTQITGSFGGNPGMISDTVCWLEIVRPALVSPGNFVPLHGSPSMLSGTIALFNEYGDGYQGYLRVLEIEADGIQATDAEIQQIEAILKNGIYVNEQ